MYRSVEEIVDSLRLLKNRGFVPTKRSGNTGVGHTLEHSLGLSENNFVVPDLGEVELKATRAGASHLITLFTHDRRAWQLPQVELIAKYGQKDGDRTNLYITLRGTRETRRLYLATTDHSPRLLDSSDQVMGVWEFESLLTQFHRKIRHLILVKAESMHVDKTEHFHYTEATFYSGWLLRWHLPRLFQQGIIHLDLRMHLKNGRVRNHGTGFRVYERDLGEIYPYGEELPV